MKKPKILVVEDEKVVAADIEDSLLKLGYKVAGGAVSGGAAIRRAVETEPDLVLMDIKLKGKMDGIEAAQELHDRLGIPVVFLTAFADGEILDRAKHTGPLGYVLKPFDERALRSALEIALHRHPRERKLAASEKRLLTALRGFDEAVILTDVEGNVTFLNHAAERLTGWRQAEGAGRPVNDVAVFLDAQSGSLRRGWPGRAIREGVGLGLGDDTVLLSRRGSEVLVEGTVNPLCDEDQAVVGAALVFQAASSEEELVEELRGGSRSERLGRLSGSFAKAISSTLDSAAEAMKRVTSAADRLDEGCRESLNVAADRVEEARGFSHKLRSFTVPGQARVVDVNEVVAGLGPLFQQFSGERSVVTRLGEKAGSVLLDPARLEKAILELFLLSVRRLPHGGRITVETDSVDLLPEYALSHTVLSPGLHTVVHISYSGAAMRPPAEHAKKDCPATYKDVIDLSGDLVLRDEPGRLTTYEIYLPLAAEKGSPD